MSRRDHDCDDELQFSREWCAACADHHAVCYVCGDLVDYCRAQTVDLKDCVLD